MQHPAVPDLQLPLTRLVDGVTETQYAQDAGLRSSELKHAARSAAHWKAYGEASRKDSDEMAFGRLVHLAVLEPDRFNERAVQVPDFSSVRAHLKAAAEWRAQLPAGTESYTAEQLEQVRAIRDAVLAHPRASRMLQESRREAAYAWVDEGFGLRCKARLDVLTDEGYAVDLKTTKDASLEAFAKEIVSRDYTLSAAHYVEGLRQASLGCSDKFFFIACEKVPPYGVAVYSLDKYALRRGRWWQRYALGNIKAAKETGAFEGYPGVVQRLSEPGYAPLPPGYTRQQLYEE